MIRRALAPALAGGGDRRLLLERRARGHGSARHDAADGGRDPRRAALPGRRCRPPTATRRSGRSSSCSPGSAASAPTPRPTSASPSSPPTRASSSSRPTPIRCTRASRGIRTPSSIPTFDVLYLTAIIHDLEAKYAIDHGRVFVAGHSQGAEMAHRMACDASADVAAIVSLAGQVTKDPGGLRADAGSVGGGDPRHRGSDARLQRRPAEQPARPEHPVGARDHRGVGAQRCLHRRAGRDGDDARPRERPAPATRRPWRRTAAVRRESAWSCGRIQNGVHHPQLTAAFAPTAWQFLTAHARP